MQINPHQADIDAILSHRGDQGGELWTTPDLRLGKGGVWSLLGAVSLLTELGLSNWDPVLQAAAELIFSTQRADGRFRCAPTGAIYPCQTIGCLEALCRLDYARDPRLEATWDHLLTTRHSDGGWRCKKFSFGHGPETESSNPGPTLTALNAFRHRNEFMGELDTAVDFLLGHWETRLPLGPCHYGIGSLFLTVEYPMASYNLFAYVYILSHYPRARKDPRFRSALAMLETKLVDGQVVIGRSNPRLKELRLAKKGSPSDLATARYHEILVNLAGEAAP